MDAFCLPLGRQGSAKSLKVNIILHLFEREVHSVDAACYIKLIVFFACRVKTRESALAKRCVECMLCGFGIANED